MFNLYCMRINLSVALVAMVNNSHASSDNGSSFDVSECPAEAETQHETEKKFKGNRYDWNPEMQGWVLSSFYYGYFITGLAGGYLADRFGAVRVLGGGLFLTMVLTFLTPLVVGWGGAVALMIVRALEGLAEGVSLPAMVSLLSSWSPRLERSRISTVVFSGCITGTIVTMWLAGWLCASDFLGGWPSVFYVSGLLTCVWFALWSFFVYESPQSHPTITPEELALFYDVEKKKEQVFKVPWKQIATSAPFWALVAGNVGSVFGLFLFQAEIPTYLSTALHFNIKDAGLFSALPYIVLFISMWTISYIADKLRSSGMLTVTAVRKIFQAISGYGPAICMLIMTVSGCQSYLIIFLFCFSFLLMGGMYSGFNTTHVDMCPDFAGTIFGLTNGISSLTGFLGPSMVGYFTANGFTLENWNKVFYTTAAINVVTTTIFLMFASAELQPWGKADPKKSSEANIQMLEKKRKDHSKGQFE